MKRAGPSLPNVESVRIAARLLKAREDVGLSQEQLAATTGIGRSTIVRYEKGNGVPGGIRLSKLAKALGKSPNELLSGADDYFPSRRPEHALADPNDQRTSVRVTMCLEALDRGVREHVSALLMAMVEAKKTKAEFLAFLNAIEQVDAKLATLQPQVDSMVKKTAQQASIGKRKK